MALRRGLAIPVHRGVEIRLYAAAQLIGLAQIELRVRIAILGQRPPFADRLGIVALLPGIDAGFHIGHGWCRDADHGADSDSSPYTLHMHMLLRQ